MAESYEDLLAGQARAPTEGYAAGGPQSYEDLVREQVGPGYVPAPPDVQSGVEGVSFYRDTAKALLGAGIVGGATALGGLPLAGYGAAAEIGGGTVGAYLGELVRQKAMGEPTSQREARKTAALNLGLSGLAKLAAEVYGGLGGIAPQYTRYIGRQNPVRAFKLTMSEPSATAELELGRNIGRQVKSIAATVTEPRKEIESMLEASTRSGTRISVQPVIDALEQAKVPNATLPETVRANAMLDERIAALQTRETAGGVTARQMDSLINKELDPSAFTRAGEVATTKLGPAYASAREAAKEQLLGNLPARAALLREQVADELTWRELAKKYFGLQRPGKAVVGTVRGLESPGSEEIRQTLREVGKQSGIDFERMAMDLATRRAFTMDDRVKINVMNRIMLGLAAAGAVSGRPGVGAAALLTSPFVAHVVSKVVAPLQNVIGPGGVSLYEYLSEEYKVREPATPMKKESGLFIRKPVADRAKVMRIPSGAGGQF